MGNDATLKLNEAAAKVTGKRFCAHHRGEAAVDAGSFVLRGKMKRWICHRCQAKSQQRSDEIQAAQLAQK